MSKNKFQPVSGFDLPRFAGVPTFMRLPQIASDDDDYGGIQIGLVGVPWDGGTTNRPRARRTAARLDTSSRIACTIARRCFICCVVLASPTCNADISSKSSSASLSLNS